MSSVFWRNKEFWMEMFSFVCLFVYFSLGGYDSQRQQELCFISDLSIVGYKNANKKAKFSKK